MKSIFTILILCLSVAASSQADTTPGDSVPVKILAPVIIKGYESQRTLAETPVAIGFIERKDMDRYTPHTMVPAINTVPGVRMEERSPGSYRLNIRGSLLRSPFGVRNIKIYWNDMPFTDAGGNTYINLVDPGSIGSIEILKGPGGSLYGANTGGVVVLHSDELPTSLNKDHKFRVQLNGGSYGTLGQTAQWKYTGSGFSSSITQSHQQSDGYRVNSKLRRDVLQWNGGSQLSKNNKLEWIALYSDIYYQTPGGLTLAQMEQNPRQARPATAVVPGAVEQKAAIYNKTIYTGSSVTHEFNSKWSNITSAAYSFTNFKNPFITNFERRKENNLSLRSKFIYATYKNEQDIRLIGGVEWQWGNASINNFGNRQGTQDTVQSKDKLEVRQWFPFVQAEWQLKKRLLVQAGASTNAYQYKYRTLTGADQSKKTKTFDQQFLPRIAVLYPLKKYLSVYTSVSKGYSPATLAEIRASDANINTSLQPEFGWNYEVGARFNSANKIFELDISAYYFKLQQAIVRRNNSAGEEYFVNAGGTDQKGLELRGAWSLVDSRNGFFTLVKLWSALTLNDYHFTNYITGTANHSNNKLTGVPAQVSVTGVDVHTRKNIYLFASLNHTAKLPLNDGNTAFAGAYDLLQAKLGWKHRISPSFSLDVYAGIDNALNEQYSLGNDINAIGNRYFNPSPIKNYFGGIVVEF